MTMVEARTSLDTKNWAVTSRPSTTPHRPAAAPLTDGELVEHQEDRGGKTMKVRLRWPALWAIS